MSEDGSSNQNKPSAPVRYRSRFPKAQPNLAVSSGLARIRRISGHYPDKKEEVKKESENIEKNVSSPSIPLTRQLVESILSPKIFTQEEESAKSPIKTVEETSVPSPSANTTFRQQINVQTPSPAQQYHIPHSVPGSPSGAVPVASVLNSHVQVYKPQFSKEHIMNIIKHKAMQKLKKIESENLKEKRKKNKKSSILFKTVQEQSVNENQSGEKIDRSKLRMKDFLYYNPRGSKKTESNEAVPDAIGEQKLCSISRSNSCVSLALNSENDTTDTPESVSSKSSTIYSAIRPTQSPVSLAPQLRISDDGTIVINEESLVIQRQEPEPIYESTVVESEHGDNLTYNSYRKFHHTKKWTERETAKFYKALSMVGTDFTMIQKFFPHRNRDEIKRKFKREEKINQAFIDKILSKTVSIDLSFFVSSSGEEDEKIQAKNKKSQNLSSDQINRSNSSNSLNESEKKKKTKLKRIQKRTFVESESESELTCKKISPDSEQNQELCSIGCDQVNLEIDSNVEKLPPCTSLFENNSQAKNKKSQNLSSDRINRSNISNSLNESEKKKKTKLKRIQKRTFVESESESELTCKKISPDSEQNQELCSIGCDQVNLEIDSNVEKLPPCTSLFENNSQALEVINQQIIRDTFEPRPSESDNESIELVFDLDNQIINEKRSKQSDQNENDEGEEGEIILDLDNNTIIHNHWGGSSITIQKLNDDEK
ncbi:transcription factor TFIIIB component B -like protein [Brachionus plicatilis]|uniref:Transcription factor TFIIIB component B-like protein n=1 Tax=Brachionus plicatilis TaxID=10195 RepID=A0A3M7RFT6_BRAPC|nr:transcription factor TFIIIB component B -like protein [Brachionus plicatilis]